MQRRDLRGAHRRVDADGREVEHALDRPGLGVHVLDPPDRDERALDGQHAVAEVEFVRADLVSPSPPDDAWGDEPEDDARQYRAHGLWAGVALLVLALVGGLAAYLTRPTACQRFVREVCDDSGSPHCAELARKLVDAGVEDEACAEASQSLEGALKATPADLHDHVRAKTLMLFIEEQLGIELPAVTAK